MGQIRPRPFRLLALRRFWQTRAEEGARPMFFFTAFRFWWARFLIFLVGSCSSFSFRLALRFRGQHFEKKVARVLARIVDLVLVQFVAHVLARIAASAFLVHTAFQIGVLSFVPCFFNYFSHNK